MGTEGPPAGGREARYMPLGGSSGSMHGAAAVFDNPDDDDDAPPSHMLQMGDVRGSGKYRGLSLGSGMVWPDAHNMDRFLTRIYRYYVGKGLATIVLDQLFNLLILGFIVVFTTFLAGCIDYHELLTSYDFHAAVNISKLLQTNAFVVMCLVVFALFWIWRVLHVLLGIRSLLQDHAFYTDTLKFNDGDLATTRWTDVVSRLIDEQPEDDPAKRLNHHDVANIIMRRENYLIAMFNQGVLRLSIPIWGSWKTPTVLTKSLEWNVDRLMDLIFDDTSIRKQFLHGSKEELVSSLRWRMRFWALVNVLFSPFILIMLVMYFVFQYGEEVHRDPGSLGARQYTPYARMLFREFNEYPHLFERRLNASYDKARDYMRLFPYENLALIARFVAFVSGAFAVVLLVLSFVDENVLLKMEIVPGHNVLWFLGVFSAIYAVARSFIPAETVVFQPEKLMRAVIESTHHYPPHWHKQLHTDMVRRQFARLFDYKVIVFMTEIVGVIMTPLILAFALPSCAEDIVDFVTEYTTQQGRVGHVCSFALFDMRKHGNPMYGAPAAATKSVSRFGKMEKSFLDFKANNPDWEPTADGAEYLASLSRFRPPAAAAAATADVTAHDLAESSLFVSSVVLSSTHSAPAGASSKGKAKGTGQSTLSEGQSVSRSAGDAAEAFASMNASVMESQGMMSLLESVYDARGSGMV